MIQEISFVLWMYYAYINSPEKKKKILNEYNLCYTMLIEQEQSFSFINDFHQGRMILVNWGMGLKTVGNTQRK